MPRLKESPSRSARGLQPNGNLKSDGLGSVSSDEGIGKTAACTQEETRVSRRTSSRLGQRDSVYNETTNDSLLNAVKDRLRNKPPKQLFRRNSKYEPEFPSSMFETAPDTPLGTGTTKPDTSPSEASNNSSLNEEVRSRGPKKLFRMKSQFEPEFPSSMLLDEGADNICTSTPFKKAAASSDAIINLSCIPLPPSRNTSKEAHSNKTNSCVAKSENSLGKFAESDDGSLNSTGSIKSVGDCITSSTSTDSSPKGLIISRIIERLNTSDKVKQSSADNAGSPEKQPTSSLNSNRSSRNDARLQKSLDLANVTFRDSRKKQSSRMLQLSPLEKETPAEVQPEQENGNFAEIKELTPKSAEKQPITSLRYSGRSQKRSLDEYLQKMPDVDGDSPKRQSTRLLQMPPQENETQDGNTAVEVTEATPKRRKIHVSALVHATDVISVAEEREINTEENLEALVVGEPQKGYTCTGCRSGVVMVDEDTSTSDLLNPEKGITIKRRCVKCLAIKLAVDVSTSTTDLEAVAEETRSNEVASSTANLIEVVLSTAEAATSTTDLNGFVVSHQKVGPSSDVLEVRSKNFQVTPSLTEVLPSNNRKSVLKTAEKLTESLKSLRSSAANANKLSVSTNVETVRSGGELHEATATERHLSLRCSSNHRLSGEKAIKLAASEEIYRTSNNFEVVPSGGEKHEASACERKRSLRSSSNHRLSGTNANELVASEKITPRRTSNNFEVVPFGGELHKSFASERQMSLRSSSNHRLSGKNAKKLAVSEEIHKTSNNLEVVPSGGELHESFASKRQMSFRSSSNHRLSAPEKTPHRTSNNFEAVLSERQMSLRSSSNHRISAKNSSERSNTNTDAAPSASSSAVAAESNEAPPSKQRTETVVFTPVDLSTLQQSNVNKKKKAPRKQKQADTTESLGIRRSTRNRKPTSLPFSIVVAANTRFLHSVNKNDYYKHENTDKESISKFVAPYLRSSLLSKMQPKKSSSSNVSAGITITEQETTRKSTRRAETKQRSTNKRTSVRKTQNRRYESPFSARNEQVFCSNSSADLDTTRADDNVSSVTNSEEKHVCGAAPELKKVKNNGDLAMGVCFSKSENTGLKSGYLEIIAGGEKLESSTRNKIVYTVWQGGADVCINGKRDRVKKGGEFIVRKGLAYSIRNVSKQHKLTLHFLKIFG